MKKVSLEELKSQLGHWPDVPVIDTITLKAEKESRALDHDIENPGNAFRIFARPGGLQLSAAGKIHGNSHYAIPFANIQSVQLMPSATVFFREASGIFYVFIFGMLFYLAGYALGGPDSGINWLPSGLVFGLLISMKRLKKEQRPTLQLTLNDGQSLTFSLATEDRQRVTDFFIHYLENKFSF
jgi:hypothetical protein